MHRVILILLVILQWAGGFPAAARQSAGITVQNSRAEITFPEKITFSASFQGQADIKDVVLEYGVDELTCGKLVAKAFPDFTPGKNASVSWSWEMKQSGSLPTGAKIWWRWNITDSAGSNLLTDKQSITWIDAVHPWKTLSAGSINLHWYQGDDTFGSDLLKTAADSIVQLDHQTGLKPEGTIDLYIYASSDDLNNTIYFQPDWTGGLAFPEYNIVLIGIPADQMVWGRHAETHELTHVLVGHLTFSCLGSLPTWLNEGLAKYSEGEWDQQAQALLKQSISDDSIFSVRSLSSSFPEDATKANLAYSQSQSLVTFLIDQYSQDKMLALLKAMQQGATTDEALKQVYGFDQDGLEDAWRAKMGARDRAAVQATAEATPLPTPVPTIVPISALAKQAAPQPAASPEPSSSASTSGSNSAAAVPTETSAPGQAGSAVFVLVCGGLACLALLVVIAIIILVWVNQRRKGAKS